MKRIDPKIIRQLFVLLLIALTGGLIFMEMLPFLSGILGAITFYVLLKKPMKLLLNKGWNENLAAGVLMFTSFIAIMVPVVGAVLMLGNKIGKAANNSEKVVKAFKSELQGWENRLGYDFTSQIYATAVSGWLSK